MQKFHYICVHFLINFLIKISSHQTNDFYPSAIEIETETINRKSSHDFINKSNSKLIIRNDLTNKRKARHKNILPPFPIVGNEL